MVSTCQAVSNEPAQGPRETLQASVYGALYDLTNNRAQAIHSGLPIPRDVFLINTRQHPNCIDKSSFDSLDGRTLILAVFWCLLNRVPDTETLAKWEDCALIMSTQRFRRKLFRSLSYSMEARLKRVRCVSRAFDGIEEINCFQNAKLGHNALANFRFVVSFYVIDKLFMWLSTGWVYALYKKTLRPIRMYFRERRKRLRIEESGAHR